MVLHDRLGDGLKEHGLAGAWRGHDKTPLAFANGGDEVHHPHRVIVWAIFQADLFIRIEGSQIIKEDLVPGQVRVFEIDLFDLQEGKVSLTLLRWPDLS